jgi:hypothetical protein
MAYEHVNGAWPVPQHQLPPLTAGEATIAVKRLIRHGYSIVGWSHLWRPIKSIRITSGSRRNKIWRGVVNPDRGWWGLVHSVSHWLAYRRHPRAKPHSHQHAFIERALIEYVVKSGWLEGKLKREPAERPKPDRKLVGLTRAQAALKRWEAKRRRADTAIRKARRQIRYYERARNESSGSALHT